MDESGVSEMVWFFYADALIAFLKCNNLDTFQRIVSTVFNQVDSVSNLIIPSRAATGIIPSESFGIFISKL